MTRSAPFHNPALTPQQNKAVEMLYNGFSREEIEDELEISTRHLSRLLHGARQRGEPVPWAENGTCFTGAVPIERLVQIRQSIHEGGFKRGVHRMIAARTGMTVNAVKVRLWKYDHGQGRLAS